ncbi:MAG: TIGR02281 family clan AA aspartic protease [Pseudomonadota bacterium]
MDSSNGPMLIWGTIVIVSIIGSLVARRMQWGQVARYATAWAAIFALVYSLFLFRTEFTQIWQRASTDLTGSGAITVSGARAILHRNEDGHFWIDAKVNGNDVRFLVDSGATITTISADTAAQLRLSASTAAFPIVVETANGMANSWPLGEANIVVGTITVNGVALHMSEQRDGVNLLGMNWLNRLQRWEVHGDEMVLTPT